AKVDLYPENGLEGRHFYGVFQPLAYVFISAYGQFREILPPEIVVLLMAGLCVVAGIGIYHLRTRKPILSAVLSFVVPSLVFCSLIFLFRPAVSYRFVLYPLFAVLPFLVIAGLFFLSDVLRARVRSPATVFVTLMAVFVVSLNSTDAKRNGLKHQLDEPSRRLIEFVRTLPRQTLLAAWPAGLQTDLIPYLAGRPLLVVFKAHYPTYEGHIVNMRKRMNDLVDAYLARDLTPLIKLHCRWQVDYLVVDRKHFDGAETAPVYFAPFKERIEMLWNNTAKSDFILSQPPADSVRFQADRFTLVDLAALPGGSDCPPRTSTE
ncbi:MAG: hypothetical protein ACR2OM_02745, partial [Aestuariivirgaceae bacterium]